MKRKSALFLLALSLGACTRYEQRPLSFKEAAAYPNAATAFGATVGAEAYAKAEAAKTAFGFDILGAGLLPVQVVFDHRGADPIEIVPSQTLLVDVNENLWNILDQKLAYSRLEQKTELGKVAPEGAKGALLGGAAGALIGAAIGVVSGTSIGEAAGKGAAVGGAGGAVLGGAKGATDTSVGQTIREDLRGHSLENKPIEAGALSHGVLFFPAEAAKPKRLRLQLKNTATGEVAILNLAL